ncbi:MAG: hypothetical protein ACXVOI_07640 [Tumebacillaceae bacterium]
MILEMGLLVLVLLLTVLIGFSTGRRHGYRTGLKDGQALTKIELREDSLRKGACPICDRTI